MREWKGAPVVIGALGLLLGLSFGGYLRSHQAYLGAPVWLLLVEIGLMVVLSSSLLAAGYWLGTSALGADDAWRVAIWCFAGLVGTVALTFWPIFYQRAVGNVVEDPLIILLISTGIGANAGALIGVREVQSRRRLEAVERTRDSLTFLNRLLRHNVLNSVNVIRGYATRMREDPDAAHLETIVERADSIAEFVTDARALVRLGDDGHELEPVDLGSVVRAAVEAVDEASDHAEIETDIQDGAEVRADDLVAAVARNLVSNAVEHNDRETPRVSVSVARRDGVVRLRVADDGPGFDHEARADAFEPGTRGDHGFGLYLVERLVDRYGGDVRIADADDRGTVVTVDLPAA